jgi:formylglycine-generating enzyme required for sulfatase activity
MCLWGRVVGLLAGVCLGLAPAGAAEPDAFQRAKEELPKLDVPALVRAVEDLQASYPGKYHEGAAMLERVRAFEKDLPSLAKGLESRDKDTLARFSALVALRQKALLANPLLDFEQMLVVKRREDNLALPQNWQGNSSLNPRVENELCLMPVQGPDRRLKTFYKPSKNYYVGDVDLNYDADKLLFSSIGSHNCWQVFEIRMDGTGLRQVTPGDEPDIDCYDAVYLPDNRIIFDSTSTFEGVPCVGGSDYVANLHLMNPDGTNIRRLCFDQDNDWYPVVMASGRVMYLRWEYTDSAHYFARVLMSMNPDGTSQASVYHNNSYWPNGLWYARPLPGSPTKFVAIISGHHGVPRMGEMVLFDVAKGRQEDTGALQRIPGYGKPVKGIIKDTLVDDSWPKFLHPYPLNEKYFLVSCKPTQASAWGIYLVDVFDNMLLLKEEPGYALFEPLPLRKTERPPVIHDKVRLDETNATVYVHDVYAGTGLRGVPRGTVKKLRVFQYEYSYRDQGGHYFVGMEGGWDVRRMIGTVPVEEDGSAMFHIPANTPVSLQPLDEEGKAMQQMRSWLVGMPGEYVSCAGCHESQNSTAAPTLGLAARKPPVDPAPWYGPKRGFSFVREVQPMLDQYCAGCHNGQPGRPNLSDPKIIPTSGGISPLPRSYVELHPYVRRNGPEGDYHVLTPLEFHANTSLLVQMLRKGHQNVKLDAEAWDRLLTWIDINVPAYGTYHEVAAIPHDFEKRRYESKKKYANVDEDIEAIPDLHRKPVAFVKPEPLAPRPAPVSLPGWPIESERAKQLQRDLGVTETSLSLGGEVSMPLKKIPAGEFVMGDVDGYGNEYPTAAARIEKPFWIGATEVSLAQYQQFDPNHRNGYYDMHYKDQVKPGYLMDSPDLPVIRVSWDQAMAFCQWLSARTGKKVLLPTEAQWEWACRAGSATPMFYGGLDSDFSTFANLADASLSKLAVSGVDPQPIENPDKFWDFVPKEARFNDGTVHLAPVGQYQPNAWGLHNMIGNVAEWTLDDYRPYPYQPQTARACVGAGMRKAVRGGSWSDRPKESRASARWDYPQWQQVYNVGFRIVVVE